MSKETTLDQLSGDLGLTLSWGQTVFHHSVFPVWFTLHLEFLWLFSKYMYVMQNRNGELVHWFICRSGKISFCCCNSIRFVADFAAQITNVLLQYFQKLNRKMHLSKVKHSKFNESGQLMTFYFASAAWGVDTILRVTMIHIYNIQITL